MAVCAIHGHAFSWHQFSRLGSGLKCATSICNSCTFLNCLLKVKFGEQIALQITPEREFFVGMLMGKDKDYVKLKGEICKLVTLIRPLLHQVQELMVSVFLCQMILSL
jgi:hypothetical protein